MLRLLKKIKFWPVFWFFFYFFLFGLLLRNSFSYLDPDLGWHLEVGREIFISHDVPRVNHYNYTFTGDWVDHEWLSNLLTFEIYDNFGYFALNIFFAAVIILSLILLNIFVRRFWPEICGASGKLAENFPVQERLSDKPSEGVIFGLQLIGLAACLPHFGVRMQEFGFSFLLLELWIIAAFEQRKSVKILFWLWPLFFLWSNMHASFLLGLGLLAAWLVAKSVERFFYRRSARSRDYLAAGKIVDRAALKSFLFLSLGSLAVTFLTPYGFGLYSFLGGYGHTFYLQAIQEWQTQFIFPFDYWQLSYLILAATVFTAYSYRIIRGKSARLDFWQFGLALFFLVLSFKSRRHFPLFFVAGFPLLVRALSVLLDSGKSVLPLKKDFKYFYLLCLFLAGIYQYSSLPAISDPFSSFCDKYPCRASKFLQQATDLQNLNILNEYNWGGYLIKTYPEKKLFIDGRLPQVEYAGHTFLEEYLEFFRPGADYAAKLDQYDIGLVLTKTEDDKIDASDWEKFIFWIDDDELVTTNYLRRYLDSAGDWERIYADPLASVYKKRD